MACHSGKGAPDGGPNVMILSCVDRPVSNRFEEGETRGQHVAHR